MRGTHTRTGNKGSQKPKFQDNSNKDLELHLGRLQKFVAKYEQELKKIKGKAEGKFPPFRNSQESIVYGHTATIPNIIKVWNLKAFLEKERQKVNSKRQQADVSRRQRLKHLNQLSDLTAQVQFCKESIQSFEERFFAPENMYPFKRVYSEWLESWKSVWKEDDIKVIN